MHGPDKPLTAAWCSSVLIMSIPGLTLPADNAGVFGGKIADTSFGALDAADYPPVGHETIRRGAVSGHSGHDDLIAQFHGADAIRCNKDYEKSLFTRRRKWR